jgi:hypothetical protein
MVSPNMFANITLRAQRNARVFLYIEGGPINAFKALE